MSSTRQTLARVADTLVVLAVTACSRAAPQAAAQTTPPPAGYAYTAADVSFMSGMIIHHAQAVRIAGWAPGHDGSAAVQRMCERIVVGQADEIAILRRWLEDRGEPAPPADSVHHGMPGMDHGALMPGMLTDQELARLDSAKGPAFDRLFLTLMIKHHQGALVMVNTLFGTPGAGQDVTVFRIANDVHADQTTEIDRMQKMLATLPPEGQGP
jgi:uncharacterized protein (DUF305 family)